MVQMEMLVSHCDMELLKMAMLRHEETFRHQVHELHRVYRVQEQLMAGLSRPAELTSCRRQIRRRHPRRALGLHLPADEYIVIAPPSMEDGLELTLAIGSGGGGGGNRRKRQRDESAGTGGTGTPLGSDISGGSLTTSSSTDTGGSGSPPYQRAMPVFRLEEATTVAEQPPPRSPWLVHCLGLKMA